MSALTRFDDYEIHPVREYGEGADRFCEVCAPEEASFWSLYGHIPGQGVECIGDFPTFALAAEIYARITGHSYGEEAPADHAARLIEVLKLALDALCQAPRFRIRHEAYRDSYQVCATIEATLRAIERGSG